MIKILIIFGILASIFALFYLGVLIYRELMRSSQKKASKRLADALEEQKKINDELLELDESFPFLINDLKERLIGVEKKIEKSSRKLGT